MAKNRKTVRKGFAYRHSDDFAAYLNHMARQGWHFKEWRAGLVFEKGEPENAVYAVEVFTKADESDIRPLPETREFAEYCEAAGWQFVDAMRKFVVFKRIREDAVPIMTDEERFENTVKAENHGIWQPLVISAIWCMMKLYEFCGFLFPTRIFSPTDLVLTSTWVALFLMAGLRAVHFLLWKYRCRRRMDLGRSLFFGKNQADKLFDLLYPLILAGCCLSLFLTGQKLLGVFLLVFALSLVLLGYIISKLRPDSATAGLIEILGSIAIVVGICFAAFYVQQEQREKGEVILEPPLTFADMGMEMGEPKVSYSLEQESIFGLKQYANISYHGHEYLFYSLYSTEYDWVLDKLWKEETDGKANETRDYCTDAWGAVEAFRNGGGSYLVRYEDALWVISPSLDEPLTQEQIDLTIAAIRGG